MKAAEECCRYLVDLYSTNMTMEQTYSTLRETSAHPLAAFGVACRAELINTQFSNAHDESIKKLVDPKDFQEKPRGRNLHRGEEV